ncbi:MAG: VIT1/CCC1 transporter family protein [Verrucomicrobia bacterium]|nr:VIT1/CCC1 transporter family protein [Verrucomicrobiota bacterium]
MTHHTPPEHFQGQSVFEHLKNARTKGALASAETHGVELPGHLFAGADSANETALAFLILWAIGVQMPIFIAFGLGWLIWKTGRSALLGYSRLERVHRLIEEERYEIEHHREQEREELREMYEVKGFSGKLLDEVVDVLMADDNRLLRVMLEEELGLSLEVIEHPLKQAFGAFLGTFICAAAATFAFYFFPTFGIPVVAALILIVTSHLTARFEKRKQITHVVWNLALAAFACAGAYFLTRLIV